MGFGMSHTESMDVFKENAAYQLGLSSKNNFLIHLLSGSIVAITWHVLKFKSETAFRYIESAVADSRRINNSGQSTRDGAPSWALGGALAIQNVIKYCT
jgi:hypothetical protein